MNWTDQRHKGESLIEWGAPAMLATACGWAALAVSGAMMPGFGAMAAVFVLGVVVMRQADSSEHLIHMPDFAVESVDPAEIDELLLDDPLDKISADSRVVSLFAPEPATPGAIVARIADYIGERGPRVWPAEDEIHGPVAGDAGAALHAALANIRASLR